MTEPQLQQGMMDKGVKPDRPGVYSAALSWISSHPGKSGTLAGWYQQGCGVAATVCAYPLVVKHLTEVNAGIWFCFQGVLAAINLTDFGLTFVLTRQIAYSLHLTETGGLANTDFVGMGEGWQGVRDVYEVSRKIFHGVSAVAVLVLAILYVCITHFGKLAAHIGPQETLAWCLLGCGSVIFLQSKPSQAVLEGLAKLYVTRFILGNIQILSGIGVVLALLLGRGIVTMSAVVCGTAVLQWLCLRHAMWKLDGLRQSAHSELPNGLISRFFRVAFPMGILNLSSFAVSYVQVPLIGIVLGPSLVPPFYLAQRIGQTLSTAVAQLVYPQMPLFTKDLANGDRPRAIGRLRRTVFFGIVGAAAANFFFLFATPSLVNAWLGPNRYVGVSILAVMSLDYLLMATGVVWAQFVFAAGRNPFVLSTVLNGVLNLLFIYFLCHSFGLIGIPLATLASGLLTNYWFTTFKGIQLSNELRLALNECE
jgi:O-antigen/teichoic acid export membrane protein